MLKRSSMEKFMKFQETNMWERLLMHQHKTLLFCICIRTVTSSVTLSINIYLQLLSSMVMWKLLKLLLTSVLTNSQILVVHALSFIEVENQCLISQMLISILKEKYKIWMISLKDMEYSLYDIMKQNNSSLKKIIMREN